MLADHKRWLAIGVALFTACVLSVALWFSIVPSVVPDAGGGTDDVPAAHEPLSASSTAASDGLGIDQGRVSAVVGFHIVVVDEARSAIADATIFAVERSDRLLDASPDPIVATSGHDGVAAADFPVVERLAGRLEAPCLYCTASGYVGSLQRLDMQTRRYVFVLRRAIELRVEFLTDAGRPVAGVDVVVSDAPFNPDRVVDRARATRSWAGKPGAICHSTSDASGVAVLHGLAPGSYFAWAVHESHLPSTPAFSGRAKVELIRDEAIVCRMAAVVASVVTCGRRGVLNASIVVPADVVDVPQSLAGALNAIKRRLQAKFRRDDLIVVASAGIARGPIGPRKVVAEGEVRLLGVSGDSMTAPARYVNVEAIDGHVQHVMHEWSSAPVSTVTVRAMTSAGTSIPNVPITLTAKAVVATLPRRSAPWSIESVSERASAVHPGVWSIEFSKRSGLSGSLETVVGSAQDAEVVLKVPDAFIRCRLELDGDDVDPPVRLGIYRDDRRLLGGMFPRGVHELWLEPGAYMVRFARGIETQHEQQVRVGPEVAARLIRVPR